jgi:hypothetical protein
MKILKTKKKTQEFPASSIEYIVTVLENKNSNQEEQNKSANVQKF